MKVQTLPNHPAHHDGPFIVGAKRFSRIAGISAMAVGALVLLGWLFEISELKSVYAGITMKANAALSFLLAGFSLWAAGRAGGRFVARLGRVCAAAVALVGALTLSQHLFGWNLGVDQLLFKEAPGALATTSPGRMGPFASACFALIGGSLLLLHARRALSVAQALALFTCLLALLPIIGYAYGAEALYGVARFTGIALHTAVTLFILGLGLLGVRAEEGPLAVVSDDRAGGLMARRLLLAAVAIPFLLGWLRLSAQRAGYFDLGFGAAVFVLALIIFFSVLIWRSAARLSHTEQQRLAAESVVREKEEGLRQQAALIELSYEPIFVWDLNEGIIEWNKGCEQLYGYTREEAIGRSNHQLLSTVFPTPLNDQLQALTRDGYWSGELRHRTREGREVIVESRQQLIESDGRRLVLETNHDISERKRAEREREELLSREQSARHRAEEANRLKDEFLATVSHELRTPLTAIVGWAHMLGEGMLDEDGSLKAVEAIRRNADQQRRIIEDILDTSRIVTGKLKLETELVELSEVVRAAVETIRLAADAKSIRLQSSVERSVAVTGDPHRLQQAVWNLLTNAVKFTPPGGEVSVRVERRLTHARVEVSDTGEGITPDFLPYVFDRFRQADGSTTREHGGLGLGLSIVRHLIEAHGGSVHAYSAGDGQGATFTLDLPIAPGAAGVASGMSDEDGARREQALNKSERSLVGGETLPPLVGVRVMLVEDDEDTLNVLTALLRSKGAEVTAVASAVSALEAMVRVRPDVIAADIGMPEVDGYELIRRLRSLGPEMGGQTPAIALTAYASEQDRAKALRVGYQAHLAKPVEPEALVSKIIQLCGMSLR